MPAVVNGVAATPYRLNAVEAFVKGKPRDKATADQAAEMAVEGAVPLLHNAYKIPLMKALASELKEAAAGQGNAIKKRDDTHKMAQANRAFAHFRF